MVNMDSKNNIDGKKKNWFISDKNIDCQWFESFRSAWMTKKETNFFEK